MTTQKIDEQALVEAAKSVRIKAYAPFSNFLVGAAVLDENGEMHTGCNVENSAYPEGLCAEANAIGAMITAGGKRIAAIAAVGGKDGLEFCTPCGGCRQKISEFADENTRIILVGTDNDILIYSTEELLPNSFRL